MVLKLWLNSWKMGIFQLINEKVRMWPFNTKTHATFWAQRNIAETQMAI